PGWTDYRKRLQYQTYDVTDLLAPGDNVLGALLGDGWYTGYVGFQGGRALYGDTPELLVQLVVDHVDGTTTTLTSDASWLAATGPIQYSDMLMGERYDARQERDGWDLPGYQPDG